MGSFGIFNQVASSITPQAQLSAMVNADSSKAQETPNPNTANPAASSVGKAKITEEQFEKWNTVQIPQGTSFNSLSELCPEVYQLMMEIITEQIIRDLQDSSQKLRQSIKRAG